MGMATYYMKAYYKDEALAAKNAKPVEAFINQLADAENYWQDNRDKTPKEFWPVFIEKFPLAYDYLGKPKDDADCNNDLAGRLSFARTDDEATFERSGSVLMYSAYVWHFANWEPFTDYIMDNFEADNVKSVSDEHLNPFDLI